MKIDPASKTCLTDQVTFGRCYRSGYVIVNGTDDFDLPIFFKILQIFIHENVPHAVCTPWQSNYLLKLLLSNLMAFQVEESSEKKIA